MLLRNSLLVVACVSPQLIGSAQAQIFSPEAAAKSAAVPFPVEHDLPSVTLAADPHARPALPAEALVTPRVRAWPLLDLESNGTVWAASASFKASFGVEGATYVPFFGSRAPRNFPLTLRTQSITIGGLAQSFTSEVAARSEGSMVSFDRGFVTESYAIARDGIEQSFVFQSLPARGEIVVSIDVESELAARAENGEFLFENDLGHVRYGRAFAFDAHGEKISLESRLVDGDIQIVVPAAFVERASLPLVIDPYIATFAVDADSQDDLNPDVAFEPSSSNALFVYEFAFSATDHDVYADRFADQIYQATVTIDATTTDWRDPRVAGNYDTANWLCVAAAGTAPNRSIRGRTIELSPFAASAQFTISGSESGDKHDPDVGGDTTLNLFGVTNYCVVWQRDFSATDTDIHARIVENDGTVVGSSVIFLVDSAGTLDSNPSISKTNGRNPAVDRDWIIVFEHEVTSTNNDIQGARIHYTGAITTALFVVANSATDEREPTASEVLDDHGVAREWLAAFEYGSALRLRVFDGTALQNTSDLTPGLFGAYGEPDLTTDGRLWHLTYRSSLLVVPNPDSDILAASLSSVDGTLYFSASPLTVANSTTYDETRPRIASTFGSGNPYRSYIVYQTGSLANLTDVQCAVYDSPVNAGGFAYCFGSAASCPCGNGGSGTAGCENSAVTGGASLSAAGQWFVSADNVVLTASQMPVGAPALYFQGSAANLTGSPFGDGLLCVSGTITRMAVKFSVGSSSSFPGPGDPSLSVAGGVPVQGGYRYYQAWHRDAVPFCTSANFNLTNGVALLWAP